MKKPDDEACFERWEDGEVALFLGKDVVADHVKDGRLAFHFGMFGWCVARISEDEPAGRE